MNHTATAGPVQRPSLALLGAEPFRAAIEYARHQLAKASLSKKGDGHPVVIFPGLGADGHSSIYSRTDGVVAWQTCRHEKPSKLVHDIEVVGSHIGMGWNREVLDAVTDRLGQAPGPWRRYVQAS